MIPVRPAIHLLNVVLLTALAYIGVKTFYDASLGRLPTPAQPPAAAAMLQPEAADKPQPLSHYQIVSRRNLFGAGAGAQSTTPPVEDLKKLEPTRLKLKLWGTIVQRGGKEYAVIENLKDRSQDLFKAGDTVAEARVKQVLREKVILTVAGRDEILQMEDSVVPTPSESTAPASPPQEAEPPEAQTQQVSIRREDVLKASENIQDLMRQVRIRPHFEEGKPAGLTLSGVKPDSLFIQMGLQSGDVLKSIEGNPIRSMNDVLKLYEQLGTSDEMSIEVKRGSALIDIQYGIE